MHKAKISNYRGAICADLEISNLTAIFGPNGAGKSSTAQAIIAGYKGDALQVPGVLKSGAIQLVNDASREGSVSIIGDNFEQSVYWPGCEVKGKGNPPPSPSDTALFFDPLTITDNKKRASYFADLLKATPTETQLRERLKSLCGKGLDAVIKVVNINGYDKASATYAEQATQKKGAFKQITGRNYGTKIGPNFMPEHWGPNLDSASKAQLEAAKVEAQEAVEACAASDALGDAELDRLRKICTEAEDIPVRLRLAEKVLKIAEDKLQNLGQIPQLLKNGDPGKPCPGCGLHLVSVANTFQKAGAENYTSAEIKVREEEQAAYRTEAKQAQEDLSKAIARVNGLKTDIENGEAAGRELAAAIANQTAASFSESEINNARENLRLATKDLDSFMMKHDADTAHKTILYYTELSDILGPNGIRKEVLGESIDALNKDLAKYFKGYPLIIGDDLMPKYDSRPLALCCESEIWRAGVAFRGVIAVRQKAAVFIIDRADILDNKGKNVLFGYLAKLPVNCLVFATVKNKSETIKLPGTVGRSYYIEAGNLAEL